MLRFFTHPIDRSVLPERPSRAISTARLGRPATVGLPTVAQIGPELRTTSTAQRVWTLGRPLLALACYVAFAAAGHWVLAAAAVAAVFLTVAAPMHDLMHRNLGLAPRANSIGLAVLGMLLLDTGHSLQTTHLEHHRRYPVELDPEAWLEHKPWWRSLTVGPFYRHHLACWAWRHRPTIRPWIALEAAWSFGIGGAALMLGSRTPILGVYVGLVVLGSWLFPVLSVHVAHIPGSTDPLRQARTTRAPMLSRLSLGFAHHLEHHMYPTVPSHKLAELVHRLDARGADHPIGSAA